MVKSKELSVNRQVLMTITRHENVSKMYKLLRDRLSSITSNRTLPHYTLTDEVITHLEGRKAGLLVVRLIGNEGHALVYLVLIWDSHTSFIL